MLYIQIHKLNRHSYIPVISMIITNENIYVIRKITPKYLIKKKQQYYKKLV